MAGKRKDIDYSEFGRLGFQKEYFAGLDLGQKHDYTALALIERTTRTYDARDAYTYEFLKEIDCKVIHAERMPLGMAYTDVVERVVRMQNAAPERQTPELVVDATGVGAPVVDLLRRRGSRARIIPVTITGGDHVTQERGTFRVPKRDLIAGLQVAFEQEELRLADNVQLVDTFIQELMGIRVKPTPRGNERMEAWRDGEHDDLVLAVSLAWWWLEYSSAPQPPFGEQPHRLVW